MTTTAVDAERRPRPVARPSPLNRRTLTGLILLGVLGWAAWAGGLFGGTLVNPGGWPLAWRFVLAAVHPDLSPVILNLALPSALVTLAYAVGSTTLSLAIGLAGGLLSSETWWRLVGGERRTQVPWFRASRAPWLAVRAVLAVPRGIHEVIWALIFIDILGLDPLSAILGIGIPYGAITAKVFADILDETPSAALDALVNSGVPPFKAVAYTLLPQAFPNLLAYAFYRLECSIRAAAVLGLIGAGGLGFQILLSLQALHYEQVWTFLYLLIALSGSTDLWSSFLHRRLAVDRHVEGPPDRQGIRRPPRVYQGDWAVRLSLVALGVLIPFSFWYVGADPAHLVAPRALHLFGQVVQESFPPNLSPPLVARLLPIAAQTLAMSILAITIAGAGGLLLSFPAASNLWLPGGIIEAGRTRVTRLLGGAAVLVAARGGLLLARALGEAIWTLLVLFVLFPGVLPGAVGLGLYNLGVLGRLMAEVAEHVDRRPPAALQGQGASGAQVFLYGVLPQTLTKDLAYILYRWEVCVRATVVVGLVGAGGLGRLLADQLAAFDYRSVFTTLLVYMALTFLVDLVSAAVRHQLR